MRKQSIWLTLGMGKTDCVVILSSSCGAEVFLSPPVLIIIQNCTVPTSVFSDFFTLPEKGKGFLNQKK